jgi:hypothetical protein
MGGAADGGVTHGVLDSARSKPPMPRLLVALLALAAILAGGLWYAVFSRTPGTAVAPAVVGDAAVAGIESAAESELAHLSAPEAASEIGAVEAGEREVAGSSREEEFARAQWVKGRVIFPPDTPLDEELYVTTNARGFEEGSHHRAKVERDGTFRVAFREKTLKGWLKLEGRYLYLTDIKHWKRGAPEPIQLEPELGGRIEAHARAPIGAYPSRIGGELKLDGRADGSHHSLWTDRSTRSLDPGMHAAFDALAPGAYALIYDGFALVGGSGQLEVAAGKTHFLELELQPGVVLAGRAVDEDGAILPGVRLLARSEAKSGRNQAGERFRSVATSADGAFRFGALVPGEFSLEASLAGYAKTSLHLGTFEEGTTLSDLELVLVRGESISGIVTWPDGSPAAAQLELTPNTDDENEYMPSINQVSDVDGHFRFTGLSASSYRIRARAMKKELVTETSKITGVEFERKERTWWMAERERVASGTADLALTLSTGLVLRGRVVDDRGVTLTNFGVSAENVEGRGTIQPSKFFRGTDGTFELMGFTPGEWRVTASALGHARSEILRVTIPAAQPVELRVPREADVSGVVLDAEGAPVPQVTVRAVQPSRAGRASSDDIKRTNAKGAFRFSSLAPGRAVFSASGSPAAPSTPLELELAPHQKFEGIVLRLRSGATIVGEVVGHDGRPQADVPIQLDGKSERFQESFTTDASGRFEAKGLPPSDVAISAESSDGFLLSRSVELHEGQTVNVRLTSPQVAPILLHGQVRASGEPLRGATISWGAEGKANNDEQGSTTVVSYGRSDAQGAYELALPGAGRYSLRLEAGKPGSLVWTTTIDVPDADDFAFDISLSIGRISGRVTDSSGAGLPKVEVRSEPQRQEGRVYGTSRTRTDTQGRYELVVHGGIHAVIADGKPQGNKDQGPIFIDGRVSGLAVAENEHVRGIDFVLVRVGR